MYSVVAHREREGEREKRSEREREMRGERYVDRQRETRVREREIDLNIIFHDIFKILLDL